MNTVRSFWTALAVLLSTAAGFAQSGATLSNRIPDPPPQSTMAQATRAPESARRSDIGVLPPVAQAQIAAAIGKDDRAYHTLAQAQGFRVDNSGHGLSAGFTSAGVDFHRGPHHWGMSLRGYGYGDMLHGVEAVRPTAAANRVEYRRGALTEWYVNGPLGLEQGFTLERAPSNSNGQPLTLLFAVSGDLIPSVDPGGRSLTLRTDKTHTLRYGGLMALDSDGRALRAWLVVAGSELRVRVDDAGARYPLTIDPYVQAPRLDTTIPCTPAGVCDDGAMWNRFGWSVAISADASTVVVGAPFKINNNAPGEGAAYVFNKPSDFMGGWNSAYPNFFATKLLASDIATQMLQLGMSVDISNDGGTIVAGAAGNGAVTTSGAVYVFIRPANGWGTNQIQTESAKLVPAPAGSFDDYSSAGRSVAISGDGRTIAAGAPSFGTTTNQTYGATYVFFRPATGWVASTESQRLTGAVSSRYGISVALSNDASTLVVGAYGKNPTSADPDYTGAAHLYVRQDNPGSAPSYVAAATLAASVGVPKDQFGWSVSANADGSTVVVGAPGDEFDTIRQHGAAYVFVRPAAGWATASSPLAETARLTTSDGSGTDGLGVSVDISVDGNTIVATTVHRKDPSTVLNAANFFAKPAAGWSTSTEDTRVVSPQAENDRFGASARLSGNGGVALIGADGTTIDASLFQGAAYIFTGATATFEGNASYNPSTSSAVQVRAVDFNVSVSPSAQTITGRKATYKITVTGVGGLTGGVAMGCAGGPSNATCVVSPSSVNLSGSTATTKATLTLPAGAANGTYTLTFTGTYGGVTRSATATLTVK